jgi:molecular chaperone DnaK
MTDIFTAEIVSADTGWTSGNITLVSKQTQVRLPLHRNGINRFDIIFYGESGNRLKYDGSRIEITKTVIGVEAIAASSSIVLEVLDKVDGVPVAHAIVKKGDNLPKKGTVRLCAGRSLKSGSIDSLRFNIYEGEIQSPVRDNEFIGEYRINGRDFARGEIEIGAEIICDYEVLDSGQISLGASVPAVRSEFERKNYFSAISGSTNEDAIKRIAAKAKILKDRLDDIPNGIVDERIQKMKQKADAAVSIEYEPDDFDKENKVLDAREAINEAFRVYMEFWLAHNKEMRKKQLDSCVSYFNSKARKHAQSADAERFDELARVAERDIGNEGIEFEERLKEMQNLRFNILWKQDWYVIEIFNGYISCPHEYSDKAKFNELKDSGIRLRQADKIDELRSLIYKLHAIRFPSVPTEEKIGDVNVVRR